MTQRRRLDAYLAEQAAAAGADFRDGVRATALEVGRRGRDGALRRLGGLGSGRDRRRRRQRADGPGARADRPARARRGARGERLPCSRARGLPRPRGGRARRRPGRLRVGLPEGRPRQRRRRRLGERRARGCARTSSAPAPRTGSPAERLESVRGYRLADAPARRPRAQWAGAARRRRGRARRSALRRRDVRGASSARGSPRSPCCGDELDGYEPALDRELGRSFAASWKAKYAMERFPRLLFGARSPAAGLGLRLRASCAATSRIRARRRGLVRAPLAPGRDARGLKTLRVAADQPQRGPECGTRPCRGTRRERYSPQGRPAAGAPARRRARPAPGPSAALRQRPRGLARDRRRHDARQALALPRERRARHRLRGRGPAAVPRQRLPPARLDLVRLPRDPERGAELRTAAPAERRRAPGRGASRPRARHRRDRLGQDDHARGGDRPHQPHAAPAHRHDRGPDRDPPLRPGLHRQPARGRARHRVVPRRDPARAAPGPRRDPDRRAPRRRDRRDRAQGRRVGPPRLLDDAHDRRRRDDRPDDRVLPGGQAGADPLDPRGRPARRRQPAAAAAAGGRPRRRGRGDGQQLPHLRPDPREQDRGDHRRDRRGPVLRHADLQPGADRARRRRRGRPRDRRQRVDQPARLPGRPRPGAEAEGRRRRDRPARLRDGAGAAQAGRGADAGLRIAGSQDG